MWFAIEEVQQTASIIAAMTLRPRWQIYLIALVYPLASLFIPAAATRLSSWLFAVTIFIIYYEVRLRRGSPRLPSSLVVGEDEPGEYMAKRFGRQSLIWLCCGFICVVTAFTALELRQPFYFTQDDALSQSLPMVLQGIHSLER